MARASVARVIHEALSNTLITVWTTSYDLEVKVRPSITLVSPKLVEQTFAEYGLGLFEVEDGRPYIWTDILTAQILMGEVVKVLDNGEVVGEISLEHAVNNADLLESPEVLNHLNDFENDVADFTTYDVLMQTLAFGEVVYG